MACMSLEQGTLYYERFGSGMPVVILHDGLLDSSVWIPLAERLTEHNEVVLYDRRGFGHSDTPVAPYSNVDDLVCLFDALDLAPAVLIGCSMGGGLGIDFTLRHPEKVRGLFLIGAVMSRYPGFDHFLGRNYRNYLPLIERGDVPECIRVPVHILVGEDDIPDVHAQSGILHDRIPDSIRTVVPGCGHLVYLEDSDSVFAIQEQFLSIC